MPLLFSDLVEGYYGKRFHMSVHEKSLWQLLLQILSDVHKTFKIVVSPSDMDHTVFLWL